MRIIVTAGPTYEPMDQVRRLTNSSTGQLGTELANFLSSRGHEVTLLLGEHATYRGECNAGKMETFSTTADLERRLRARTADSIGAIFHAAAVSDFKFAKVWSRSDSNELAEITSGKISTRQGTLLAELVPTPKIIGKLREWFPATRLVGWKFEVEGDRVKVIDSARKQLTECRTDACVANGPAYGPGFGLVTGKSAPKHFQDRPTLFAVLLELLENQ